jgi:hypothetical protein
LAETDDVDAEELTENAGTWAPARGSEAVDPGTQTGDSEEPLSYGPFTIPADLKRGDQPRKAMRRGEPSTGHYYVAVQPRR